MKSINTLVSDIEAVVMGNGGWDASITKYLSDSIGEVAEYRFAKKGTPREGTLRMSNIGTPCKRKLWYHVKNTPVKEEMRANTLLKFAYGDIIESLILSLARAAGHTVEGEQDEVVVDGIVGHRDCVIDGVVVDVKSAAPASFTKFEKNNLRLDDPFGYLPQLTGYVYAAKDDPLVKDKTGGAFLVMDKVNGNLCLDYYDLTDELHLFPKLVSQARAFTSIPVEPHRHFEPVPDGKSGNMKLAPGCSYCEHKWTCWPGLRGFAYSNGPTYLTRVVRKPEVPEFKA